MGKIVVSVDGGEIGGRIFASSSLHSCVTVLHVND